MVFLYEEYLWWVLERGQPSLNEFLLGQVFPQPSHVEGDDYEGSFRHASLVLGQLASRLIPCDGLDPVLGWVEECFRLASR